MIWRLLVDKEDELGTEDVAVLSEQQKADLVKTAGECEETIKGVKGLLQNVLWSDTGAYEAITALQVAEAESRCTAAVDLNSRLEGGSSRT